MKAISILGDAASCAQACEYFKGLLWDMGIRPAVLHDTGTKRSFLQTDYIELASGSSSLQLSKRLSISDVMQLSDAPLLICMNVEDPHIAAVYVGELPEGEWPPNVVAQIIMPDAVHMRDGRTFATPGESKEFLKALLAVCFRPLPGLNCGKCGRNTCADMCADIVQQKATRSDCVVDGQAVTISLDGKTLPLVGFVEKMVHNVVVGMAQEMKGYDNPRDIVIHIRREDALPFSESSDK